MARILIAGCGDVGTRLGLRLAACGHQVFGLRRNAGRLPPPLNGVAADLNDAATLQGLPDSIEYLHYTAAADRSDDAAYKAAYVDGLVNVLGALRTSGACLRRLLFISSTSVYGQSDGAWVDETEPTRPASFSGRRLLEGERTALEGAPEAVVVRFGGIYGPGRERLITRVREGAPCVADPPTYTNRIHVDDCAGVMAHLMALPAPESVYIGVDSAPAAQCEVMDWLAGRLSVPRPPRAAPAPHRQVRGNKRCRNDRLRSSGYRFQFPSYREGYAAILATTQMGATDENRVEEN
ncbi:MAG: sugar nucleotide-binding protein [Gammaproteobacteria bacterium]